MKLWFLTMQARDSVLMVKKRRLASQRKRKVL